MQKVIFNENSVLVRQSELAKIMGLTVNMIQYYQAKSKLKRVGLNKKWYDLRAWLVFYYGVEHGTERYNKYREEKKEA